MKTFSFIKNQKIFFGIVAVVFIIGLVSFFINGFNVDIDFVGGTEITYDINKTVTKDDEAAIEKTIIDTIGDKQFSSIRVSGETVIVRTLVADSNDNTEEVSKAIDESMKLLYPDAVLDTTSTVTNKIFSRPVEETVEEVTEAETTEETADDVAEEAEATDENAEEATESVDETTVEEEKTPAWSDEDISKIESALAETGADGLTVSVSNDQLHVSFESSSPVAKLRSDITDAITELYDNTSVISADIDAAVTGKFAGVVLSESSTETSKVYTLETAELGEDGNPVMYTWTEEDKAAVEEAVKALGIENYSVQTSETELYVDFVGGSSVEWLSADSVSAEISAGLRSSAIKATVIAVILMLIYIAFRFQISSAFAAIVCLTHDLFVMLVAYSLFQIPVNSTIIAALLTILGYSINATIIIFDRIRENDKKFTDGEGFSVKVDDGIRNTIWRSINTTLTTLFTIGMIYFLGVTSIKNFALPLIVGIVAGLFSSVCLAGPLWRLFKKLGKKIRNK